MTREKLINQAAVEYAFTTPSTIVEAFEAGAKFANEDLLLRIRKFLESTDFCRYYNKEFIDEFLKSLED